MFYGTCTPGRKKYRTQPWTASRWPLGHAPSTTGQFIPKNQFFSFYRFFRLTSAAKRFQTRHIHDYLVDSKHVLLISTPLYRHALVQNVLRIQMGYPKFSWEHFCRALLCKWGNCEYNLKSEGASSLVSLLKRSKQSLPAMKHVLQSRPTGL